VKDAIEEESDDEDSFEVAAAEPIKKAKTEKSAKKPAQAASEPQVK